MPATTPFLRPLQYELTEVFDFTSELAYESANYDAIMLISSVV